MFAGLCHVMQCIYKVLGRVVCSIRLTYPMSCWDSGECQQSNRLVKGVESHVFLLEGKGLSDLQDTSRISVMPSMSRKMHIWHGQL